MFLWPMAACLLVSFTSLRWLVQCRWYARFKWLSSGRLVSFVRFLSLDSRWRTCVRRGNTSACERADVQRTHKRYFFLQLNKADRQTLCYTQSTPFYSLSPTKYASHNNLGKHKSHLNVTFKLIIPNRFSIWTRINVSFKRRFRFRHQVWCIGGRG